MINGEPVAEPDEPVAAALATWAADGRDDPMTIAAATDRIAIAR
ncbi:MAG: hypothetical protein ACREMD_03175 [Gemmatimonadota bacterium]